MKIKVERKEQETGWPFYRVWLGDHFTDISNKELIDLFTEINNAVPTAPNTDFNLMTANTLQVKS